MMEQSTKANTRAGTRLIADGGFTCLLQGDVVEVQQDDRRGLFVGCSQGRHYLDGQEDDQGRFIGFSVVEEIG